MRIPLSWLKDYVSVPSVPDLEEGLRMSGTEIEKVHHPDKFEGVVVGKVLSVKKHPDADKLKITVVDTGKRFGKRTIICGAPNVRTGQFVPVALPGAELPGGMIIKEAKIRGVHSEGMICSEDELGLASEEQHGILVLPKSTIGSPFMHLAGTDTILEAEITPNRADEFGLIGIAREVAVIFNKKLRNPADRVRFQSTSAEKKLKVDVKNPKDCPRYTAAILSVKSLKESPKWMTDRLKNAGYRPINLAADVTNYVMHETGQPLHAFDLDKLAGRSIIVRRAKAGEKIVTLDGVERRLDPSILVIADAKKPVAIAGVMGGLDSSVTAKTKNIVIESANFDPILIRAQAKKLALRTDAVTRFEKGQDQDATLAAATRACALLQKLSSAQVYKDPIDVAVERKARTVLLDLAYAADMLGAKIAPAEAVKTLEALGFKKLSEEGLVLEFTIPSYRRDVTASHDLVEEIARIKGYDVFPNLLPSGRMPKPVPNTSFEFERRLKQVLISLGLSETVTFSFISKEKAKSFGVPAASHIQVSNPLSSEIELMRTELLSSLVPVAAENLKHRDTVSLFESAAVYRKEGKKIDERKAVCAVVAGDENSFRKLKGILEAVLTSLQLRNVSFKQAKFARSHPGRGAQVYSGKTEIGHIAELHPELSEVIGRGRVAYFELDLSKLITLASKNFFTAPPIFPSIEHDVSLVVRTSVTYANVLEVMGKHDYLREIEFIESYQGKGIPRNKRSITVRLSWNAGSRTLEEAEIKKLTEPILAKLKEELEAEIR